MSTYLRLLRVPRLAPLLAVMTLARLPIGINGLAIVLLVQDESGSFATAGVVAGALALGTGGGAPVQGRLVDRLGLRMLVPLAVAHAVGLLALLVLASAHAPVLTQLAAALIAGFVVPPVSSVLRTRYRSLLRGHEDLAPAAFAFDSVLTELIFVAGPLMTAGLVVLVAPGAALVLSAAAVVGGTLGFLALLPASAGSAGSRGTDRGGLGALNEPAIRTLVLTMLPMGIAFGALEVALPAFSEEQGRPELAGVLIAVWALASAAGGFVYGSRPRRAPLPSVHLRFALLLPLALLPLAAAPGVVVMALLVVPAGILIAPLIASRNELAGAFAPPGAETEALTWPLTALVGGVALGAAAAGGLAEQAGWRTAVLFAVGSAVVGAAVALGRRRSFDDPTPAQGAAMSLATSRSAP